MVQESGSASGSGTRTTDDDPPHTTVSGEHSRGPVLSGGGAESGRGATTGGRSNKRPGPGNYGGSRGTDYEEPVSPEAIRDMPARAPQPEHPPRGWSTDRLDEGASTRPGKAPADDGDS
jgi:hypothetical protein